MPTDTFDSQPDDAELLQLEDSEPAVDVHVKNPVRIQQLPTKAAAPRAYQVNALVSTRILVADHKRASALIVCTGFPVIITAEPISATDVSTGFYANGFPLPIAAQLPTLTSSTLYAIAVGGTAVVGVFAENWAAGDD